MLTVSDAMKRTSRLKKESLKSIASSLKTKVVLTVPEESSLSFSKINTNDTTESEKVVLIRKNLDRIELNISNILDRKIRFSSSLLVTILAAMAKTGALTTKEEYLISRRNRIESWFLDLLDLQSKHDKAIEEDHLIISNITVKH